MDTRQRILEVTADLLQRSPGEPVSTRAICEAAGISAPTLYHHFGDKEGLYDAVISYGFETYLDRKHALTPSSDPIADLRRAWDVHVQFGVEHPALYTLMYGSPPRASVPPAAIEAQAILTGLIERAEAAGLLRDSREQATRVIEAASVGVTLQAIHSTFDRSVSTRLRELVFGSVLVV